MSRHELDGITGMRGFFFAFLFPFCIFIFTFFGAGEEGKWDVMADLDLEDFFAAFFCMLCVCPSGCSDVPRWNIVTDGVMRIWRNVSVWETFSWGLQWCIVRLWGGVDSCERAAMLPSFFGHHPLGWRGIVECRLARDMYELYCWSSILGVTTVR